MYKLMVLKYTSNTEKWEKLTTSESIPPLIHFIQGILLDKEKDPGDLFFKYQIVFVHPEPEPFETVLLTIFGAFDPKINKWPSPNECF